MTVNKRECGFVTEAIDTDRCTDVCRIFSAKRVYSDSTHHHILHLQNKDQQAQGLPESCLVKSLIFDIQFRLPKTILSPSSKLSSWE